MQDYDLELPPDLDVRGIDFSATTVTDVSGAPNAGTSSTVGGRAFLKGRPGQARAPDRPDRGAAGGLTRGRLVRCRRCSSRAGPAIDAQETVDRLLEIRERLRSALTSKVVVDRCVLPS